MSETVEETPKKKGGPKLPILLALVILLAGGGYFAFKLKSSGKAAEKPKVELGEVVALDEFLVNLNSGTAYLRAEISLQLRKGYEKADFDKNLAAVRDSIVMELSSKQMGEVTTMEGKIALKRRLAEAINAVLAISEPEKEAKPEPKNGPKAKKPAEKPAQADSKPGPPKNPDWDSDEGPVLRVFFTGFTTQ
ncbi:MAG: hypothetical protein EDM74_07410 [Armatimonadetes bacterium]|nr:MAG: hypothetical protein EDM74_07410 [Armatimonadota bacterium]